MNITQFKVKLKFFFNNSTFLRNLIKSFTFHQNTIYKYDSMIQNIERLFLSFFKLKTKFLIFFSHFIFKNLSFNVKIFLILIRQISIFIQIIYFFTIIIITIATTPFEASSPTLMHIFNLRLN